MIEELSGRKNFNSNLYLQNDELGKKLAIKILANINKFCLFASARSLCFSFMIKIM